MPDPAELIALTAEFVRRSLPVDSAHDWFHIDRVRRNALQFAREEQADSQIVELASLLHDIADWKFHGGDESAGPLAARAWLERQQVDTVTLEAVCEIVSQVSFKGAGVPTDMSTLEGKCVQDADRLDAIGAIGIARAFSFGGSLHRPLYDHAVPPEWHESFAAYKSNSGSTVNHFYEKLLLLKDRMQTSAGQRLAVERHHFMETFLTQFFAEWNGAAIETDVHR